MAVGFIVDKLSGFRANGSRKAKIIYFEDDFAIRAIVHLGPGDTAEMYAQKWIDENRPQFWFAKQERLKRLDAIKKGETAEDVLVHAAWPDIRRSAVRQAYEFPHEAGQMWPYIDTIADGEIVGILKISLAKVQAFKAALQAKFDFEAEA